MFNVYRSNRLEDLAGALADTVRVPLPDPTAAECVVVQSRGMQSWIAMRMAERFGVWAHAEYPFPRAIIERIVAAVLGERDPAQSRFHADALSWAVMAQLDALLGAPELGEIAGYLKDDPRGIKRFQLAQRIARTFDQYTVYRPELIRKWSEGEDDGWQAVLWRACANDGEAQHAAATHVAYLERLRDGQPDLSRLPPRIGLFGVSSLPPMYLDALAAIADRIEINLFVLAPSDQYWAHIRSTREIRHAVERSGGATAEDLHHDIGHPLLASFGALGRDFQGLLEGTGEYVDAGAERFVGPGDGCLLHTLQSDVLDVRHRRRGSEDAPPQLIADGDNSIQMHSCHSPMREVETVRDRLRDLLERDADLQPEDIIVMVPDIEGYAPLIEAVFGAEERGLSPIPYRVSDRSVRRETQVIDAVLAILELVRSRVTASAVLDLLAIDVVSERFDLDADALERVHGWVADAGIRFGIDAAHREALGQPAYGENTWRFGLDRMLLGYALPGEDVSLFEGVLPYDHIEGNTADDLGRFAQFCELLFAHLRALDESRTVTEWGDALRDMMSALIAETSRATEHQLVRDALSELVKHASTAGFDDPVDLDVIRTLLSDRFDADQSARGFLTGGVTFCALLPMRSIPFKVVWLLGMSDGSFPRAGRPLGFDLIAQHPRPGDRAPRDDDRYLFMEAILSARQSLNISFVGQSIRDNSSLPPSVVVSALIDIIAEGFCTQVEPALSLQQTRESISKRLITEHPLQPFSPSYYTGEDARGLFSYSPSGCAGAAAVAGTRVDLPAFVSAPVAEDEAVVQALRLDDLVRYFKDPTKAFVHSRIGIYLGDDDAAIEDLEPRSLDGLQVYALTSALVGRTMAGDTAEQMYASTRARGVLPLGTPGICFFEDELQEIAGPIADAVNDARTGERRLPLAIDLKLGDERLTGHVDDLWSNAQVSHSTARTAPKYEIALWIRHLALLACAEPGAPQESLHIGRGDPVSIQRFADVDDPRALLADLIAVYRLGQQAPLPLFPRVSEKYAARVAQDGDPEALEAKAISEAEACWHGTSHSRGELDDAYVKLAFRGQEPLESSWSALVHDEVGASTFTALARRVFGPLIRHRVEAD